MGQAVHEKLPPYGLNAQPNQQVIAWELVYHLLLHMLDCSVEYPLITELLVKILSSISFFDAFCGIINEQHGEAFDEYLGFVYFEEAHGHSEPSSTFYTLPMRGEELAAPLLDRCRFLENCKFHPSLQGADDAGIFDGSVASLAWLS